MFEKIRRWYILGLWTEAMVENAVAKAVLTGKEAESILETEERSE